MAHDAPTAPGLHPVAPGEFLRPYLALQKTPATAGQLVSRLSAQAPASVVRAGLEELMAAGQVSFTHKRYALAPAGRRAVAALGRLDRPRLTRIVWPALALGLDPAGPAAAKLGNANTLRAAVLTALYRLPLKNPSLEQAVGALIARGLTATPPPEPPPAFKAVVEAVGLPGSADRVRQVVIMAALRLSTPPAAPSAEPPAHTAPPHAPDSDRAFAHRVAALVTDLVTPPLADAVAVAQVYDAYGRQHADAGGLAAFKTRLKRAHEAGLLALRTLDRPEILDKVTRERSEITGRYRSFHLVIREQKA